MIIFSNVIFDIIFGIFSSNIILQPLDSLQPKSCMGMLVY